MANNTKTVGNNGENYASQWLSEHCQYQILHQNWRAGRLGEIDLIALTPSKILAFIEVKTRRGKTAIETAMAAITPKKQQQMTTISNVFIAENSCYQKHTCQFDVVAINWPTGHNTQPNQVELVHLPNAFSS